MLSFTLTSGVALARPWRAEPAPGNRVVAYQSGADAFSILDPKQRPSAPCGWAT